MHPTGKRRSKTMKLLNDLLRERERERESFEQITNGPVNHVLENQM